jgi:hypothetical protein
MLKKALIIARLVWDPDPLLIDRLALKRVKMTKINPAKITKSNVIVYRI